MSKDVPPDAVDRAVAIFARHGEGRWEEIPAELDENLRAAGRRAHGQGVGAHGRAVRPVRGNGRAGRRPTRRESMGHQAS